MKSMLLWRHSRTTKQPGQTPWPWRTAVDRLDESLLSSSSVWCESVVLISQGTNSERSCLTHSLYYTRCSRRWRSVMSRCWFSVVLISTRDQYCPSHTALKSLEESYLVNFWFGWRRKTSETKWMLSEAVSRYSITRMWRLSVVAVFFSPTDMISMNLQCDVCAGACVFRQGSMELFEPKKIFLIIS